MAAGDSAIDELAGHARDEDGDALQFYELEGQILELWDRLHELKLEISLLDAQTDASTEIGENDVAARLAQAEKECLEARAAYVLKNRTVTDALLISPTLKAIHSGLQASPTERALASLIKRRDTLSISCINMTSHLQQLELSAMQVEATTLSTHRRLRDVGSSVSSMHRETDARKERILKSDQHGEQLNEVIGDTRLARKRWRIMKSVLSAMVVGSGLDWASDEELLALVIDPEDENDSPDG